MILLRVLGNVSNSVNFEITEINNRFKGLGGGRVVMTGEYVHSGGRGHLHNVQKRTRGGDGVIKSMKLSFRLMIHAVQ